MNHRTYQGLRIEGTMPGRARTSAEETLHGKRMDWWYVVLAITVAMMITAVQNLVKEKIVMLQPY
jgi:hypothetical protein